MPPPPLPEEITQLMRFIAEKAKNVKSPMNIAELCRQFKEETGSSMALKTLYSRIKKHRQKIHEMDEFDMELKVKLIFALSAPIDAGFLVEMKKVADVEVDDQQRIIHYKQKDGGLILPNSCSKLQEDAVVEMDERGRIIKHKGNDGRLKLARRHGLSSSPRELKEKQLSLTEFLIERTKDAKYPMSIHCLAVDFRAKFNSSESQKCALYRIESFRQGIWRLNQFDMSTKVKMMFALGAPVDGRFLKIIQKDAFVELDEDQRIKKYKANDGSLELAAIQKGRKRVRQISEEDDGGEPLKFEDHSARDFDYDPSSYKLDMGYIPIENKPETLIEVKTEVPEGPSASNSKYRYEENLFDYDPSTYKKDLEHFPEEKKPENYLEVKLEVPEESSTNNLEYHNEDILTEPKPE